MIALDIRHPVMYILEFLIIYFLGKKATQIYRYVKMMEFGLQY